MKPLGFKTLRKGCNGVIYHHSVQWSDFVNTVLNKIQEFAWETIYWVFQE
jgi:hypothetical protein